MEAFMNAMRTLRTAGLIALAMGAALIGSCSDSPAGPDKAVIVAKVSLARSVDSLLVEDSLPLAVTIENASGVPLARNATWTSSNPTLATVSAQGVVRALDGGVVTITATVDGVQATTQLYLLERVTQVAMNLNQTRDTLRIRDTLWLQVQLRDPHGAALQRQVTWRSSDSTVVRVGVKDAGPPALSRGAAIASGGPQRNTAVGGSQGYVLAMGPGTAVVTVTAEGKTDSLTLMVGEPVATVELSPASAAIGLGARLRLQARLRDRNQVEIQSQIAWTSSDSTVATVDSTGLVTGMHLGNATITATSEGKSASAMIAVVAPAAGFTVQPATVVLMAGRTLQLAWTVTDLSGAPVTRVPMWESSAPEIVSVDANGLVTTHVVGTAQITGTVDGLTAVVPVNVVPAAASMTIQPASVTLAMGESVDFTVTMANADGTPIVDRTVVWMTSESFRVLVDTKGHAVARNGGPATVTATAGDLSATATINVTVPVVSVSVAPTADSLLIGDTVRLVGTAHDARGGPLPGISMSWMSAQPSIATVDGTGLVTAVAEGSASIRVTHGELLAAASIAVFRHPSSVVISPPQAQVRMGDHITVKGTPKDESGNSLGGKVTYTTSDASIATVSTSGVVTGVAEGTVTITASSGGKSASAQVTVSGPRPSPETAFGNNLSVPVVFSEGIGITGLPVTVAGAPNYANTGLRPGATENLVVNGLPYFYAGNVSDCTWPDGTKAYCQKGLNAWQAQWLDGSAALQHASATWGDNIISQSLQTSAPVRVEVSLNDLTSGTLSGFNMQVVSGTGSTESQGTNGVTAAMTPTIYSVMPHLIVSKLDTSGGNAVGSPLVDKRVIDALGAEEGPGNFAAEVNVGGKIVYGYNLRVSEAGWYRVAFVLEGSATNGVINATRNVTIDALTNSATEEESGGSGGSGSGSGGSSTGTKPAPHLAGDGSSTWIDIYIGAGSGSGEGGGGSGGGDTGAGNNLSVPITFAEGLGLGGLPVTVDGAANYVNTGLRPTGGTEPVVGSLPYFPTSYNVSNCSLGGTQYFCQGGAPVWQAQWFDASGQASRDAQVAWGDNLLTNHFNTHANVHVEVSLTDLTTPAMQGFNMTVISGTGSTELKGTDGTTGTFSPMVYTRGARLKVELLDSATHEPRYTLFDKGLWELVDGSGQFSTEVSMGGTLVYSYNLLMEQITVPTEVGHKYGWYRFTFSIDGSAPVTPNVRMTLLAGGGESGTTEEGGGTGGSGSGGSGSGGIPSKNVPTLNVGAQSTSIDIWVDKGSGSGSHL